MIQSELFEANCRYWTGRAPGYSEVNRTELNTKQHQKWRWEIYRSIRNRFPDMPAGELRVLDAGCGPGFFSVILAELGFDVTAIDLSGAMIREAEENAGRLAEKIKFLEMNAEKLDFPDASFHAVVSRNLTWNLPHPEKAYQEWMRVLVPGGLLLNFDANWYRFLFDEEAARGYEEDRKQTALSGIKDENIGENFDVMEQIARQVPLSKIQRPQWDRQILTGIGMKTTCDPEIWKSLWSAEEKINFSSTPLFMLQAVKSIDNGNSV